MTTTDYSEYTVKNSTETSFYGSDCTQEDADRIAKAISDLIRTEFPGINVEEWSDGNVSSKTTGPDESVIEEINDWIANNWTAAL
jgi:hypothetical protein